MDAETAAITQGMARVMLSYEAELPHPIRNLMAGDLARSLLIQVGCCFPFCSMTVSCVPCFDLHAENSRYLPHACSRFHGRMLLCVPTSLF
jgi:hypothetical protein